MKIGLVGLGRMGTAMSQRLREHGFDIVGWDVSCRPKQGAGCEADCGSRPIPAPWPPKRKSIISIITEDHGVRHIFNGADGFLAGDVKGKLFIEMSTLQPMTGARARAVGRSAGVRA